ncbi:hypothetical protein ACIQVL_30645 [Streptomyces sp. NPDC090499]|uniref:hypothetical protein n=1 Tax=unclassified Streptomyces TaxID=2593676 RepID=UPI0038137663
MRLSEVVTTADGSPQTAGTSLVVIDMTNTYDRADAELLVPAVGRIAPAVADLIGEARKADVPVRRPVQAAARTRHR